MEEATTLELQPLTPAVGAIAHGIDLRVPLAPDASKAIRAAVLEHGVVFFRDQALLREELLAFMENFGTPCMDPFAAIDHPVPAEQTIVEFPTLGYGRATSLWHIDSSLAAEPASFIALRALEVPSSGGDTCWASAIAAYERLSEPLRRFIDGLHAVHSASKVLPLMSEVDYGEMQEDMRNVHPVVRVHPETGRKALFVDELWTEAIVDLQPAESDHLLALLREHLKRPEFTVRWRWRRDDVALWDNRAFQHYAVNDYRENRVMQKSLIAGDRPQGPP